jgi:hypothetical protein
MEYGWLERANLL